MPRRSRLSPGRWRPGNFEGVPAALERPALEQALASALEQGAKSLDNLRTAAPVDERDSLLALLRIYDLHLAPVGALGGTERWQHHPAVADLKWRLEAAFVDSMQAIDNARGWALPDEPVAAIRAVAAVDRVPPIYDWLAAEATWEEVIAFIALEGGPDGGFDDLVAICQLGLFGEAKLEMARNYWDEMGRGDAAAVHTELHRRLAEALELRPGPRHAQPLIALRRSALGPFLATNRMRQAEMVGALGLIELQAGPRCRRVVSALERLAAPAQAAPFYAEHASTDPVHGRRWLSNVVPNFAGDDPVLSFRVVQGARWRSSLNREFLRTVGRLVGMPDQGASDTRVLAAG